MLGIILGTGDTVNKNKAPALWSCYPCVCVSVYVCGYVCVCLCVCMYTHNGDKKDKQINRNKPGSYWCYEEKQGKIKRQKVFGGCYFR